MTRDGSAPEGPDMIENSCKTQPNGESVRYPKGLVQGDWGAARCSMTGSPQMSKEEEHRRWVTERTPEEESYGPGGVALPTLAKITWVSLHPIPRDWGQKDCQGLTGKSHG
jgi:hypothetical protein